MKRTIFILTIVILYFTMAFGQNNQTKKSTSDKAKEFVEKQAYSQTIKATIGVVAGQAVKKTAGGVIGGVAAPTHTVDQKIEMRQRDELIKRNMQYNKSPYYNKSQYYKPKGKAVLAK